MTHKYEFTTAEGKTCCASDDPTHLCEHCRAAAEGMTDGRIPDPYAEGLKQLRAAEGIATPPMTLDANGVPDPYAVGLAKMRSANR